VLIFTLINNLKKSMDLIKAIETRTSVRKFSDDPVDINDIREIIRLAGLAPSINNYQPWKYYIITNSKLLNKMAFEITREISEMPESSTRLAKHLKNQAAWFSTFFQSAPMFIALAAHPYEIDLDKGVKIPADELDRMRNYPELQSSGASIQNLLLAATSMGYGTCWMTGPLYARETLQHILGISEPWKLISFVAIGKSDEKGSKVKTKRNLADEMEVID
jgi:nitroreductase